MSLRRRRDTSPPVPVPPISELERSTDPHEREFLSRGISHPYSSDSVNSNSDNGEPPSLHSFARDYIYRSRAQKRNVNTRQHSVSRDDEPEHLPQRSRSRPREMIEREFLHASQRYANRPGFADAQTPIACTISKDNTLGEHVRHADLLAHYGQRLRPKSWRDTSGHLRYSRGRPFTADDPDSEGLNTIASGWETKRTTPDTEAQHTQGRTRQQSGYVRSSFVEYPDYERPEGNERARSPGSNGGTSRRIKYMEEASSDSDEDYDIVPRYPIPNTMAPFTQNRPTTTSDRLAPMS